MIGVMGASFFLFTNHWIDVSVLENYDPGRPSIVLDEEGKEWTRFQLDRRDPISLEAMPPHLINAFLAAEDWQFFSHYGISWRCIIRSMLVNLYHGRKVQGASTITQQLVKLLFFDSQKTFYRKVKEQLYALIIERQFTKEQILEIYLNHVYFGCGIYGVEAASQRFWRKHAFELTIDEAATLAAIIRNPARYCPLLSLVDSQQRRNIILHSMHKLSFINQAEYDAGRAKQLAVLKEDEQCCAPHVKEMLRTMLEELVGKQQLYSGGLVIQTTINQRMQDLAQREFKKHCMALRSELSKPIDGGMIVMDVKNGGIKVLVGGADFNSSKFNRATQAKRQLGSIFKPIVYAVALQQGMSFADVEEDEPIQVEQNGIMWSPKNFDSTFHGRITRAYALSHSNNIVTIKTLLKTGFDPVIDLAQRLHLPGPLNPYPSLALGCIDVTLKDAVGMFNAFANDGVYVEPHYIMWIKDQWGTKIYKQTVEKKREMSTRIASQVAKVLRIGIERSREWFRDQWIESEAMSKTGTTNESRTCWYVGSTPSLTTAIYVGCDDNQSLGKNIYPSRTVLPLWLSFNRAVPSPLKTFSYDRSLSSMVINEKTGRRSYMSDPDAIEILI